jgi:hypothetical protein
MYPVPQQGQQGYRTNEDKPGRSQRHGDGRTNRHEKGNRNTGIRTGHMS